ncbi:MAG: type II secretion system protein GspJ [Planctomycetota bacterium]|nr:type II secretion system protein GspJ [Planctomycetota bacterium]
MKTKRTVQRRDLRHARGMTLLELMLALSLSALIFVAIGMAMDLNVRAMDVRQGNVEEAQLARAILKRISDDLRGAVRPSNVETEEAQQMTEGAVDSEGAGDSSAPDTDAGTGPATPPDVSSVDMATEDGATGDAATEVVTEDASSLVPPPQLGVYGTQYQLQVDVSRLPRPDEYNPVMSSTQDFQVLDIPSDIKSVAYYLQAPQMLDDVDADTIRFSRQEDQLAGGLVRRELDRSMARYAAEMGDTTILAMTGEVLAPEVTSLEFQYFDGLAWLTAWDSASMQGLPQAVRVILTIRPARAPARANPVGLTNAATAIAEGDLVYSLVVRLPLAEPPETMGDSAMEAMGL